MTSSNKPAEKISVGSVTATVWRNETEDGKTFYKTAIENRYRQGEEWKTSNSFGKYDLVNLAKAALLAHSAVLKLSRAGDEESGPDAQDEAA